jgi:hypothetical protein
MRPEIGQPAGRSHSWQGSIVEFWGIVADVFKDEKIVGTKGEPGPKALRYQAKHLRGCVKGDEGP